MRSAPLPLPPVAPLPDPIPRLAFTFPTAQANLRDAHCPRVFMPTASGRPESALYGSTRTRMASGRARPSFHEGIDIAPLHRDRRGRPTDSILAVATGTVAHINRHAGNSNYGIHIVLRHPDPIGDIYTLYAHLASVAPGLAVGHPVSPGAVLGVLGHTGGTLPVARAHLHFEIGVIANGQFASWRRARRPRPDPGRYHGWNLLGVDPLAVFGRPEAAFSMRDYLLRAPAAFDLLMVLEELPDYFRRYPSLWIGDPPRPRAGMVWSVSEGGVPLRARNATEPERAILRNTTHAVLRVDDKRLGPNGRGLIASSGNRTNWRLTVAGEEWLDILLHPRKLRSGAPEAPGLEETDP